LGLIRSVDALEDLIQIADHSDPYIRLQTIIALGNYQDKRTTTILINALDDPEKNVRWDAAVALAKLKNNSGRMILLDLLDRNYLDSFPNIDPVEQNRTILIAIQAISQIIDPEFERVLLALVEKDKNMKVREAARKVLNI